MGKPGFPKMLFHAVMDEVVVNNIAELAEKQAMGYTDDRRVRGDVDQLRESILKMRVDLKAAEERLASIEKQSMRHLWAPPSAIIPDPGEPAIDTSTVTDAPPETSPESPADVAVESSVEPPEPPKIELRADIPIPPKRGSKGKK